jgi:hypothetical protein
MDDRYMHEINVALLQMENAYMAARAEALQIVH